MLTLRFEIVWNSA